MLELNTISNLDSFISNEYFSAFLGQINSCISIAAAAGSISIAHMSFLEVYEIYKYYNEVVKGLLIRAKCS